MKHNTYYYIKILILIPLFLCFVIHLTSNHIYAQSENLEYLITMEDIEANPDMLHINATIYKELYYIEGSETIKRTASYIKMLENEDISPPKEMFIVDDRPIGFFCTFFTLIGFIIGLCFDELVIKNLFVDYSFVDAYRHVNATSNDLVNDLIVNDIDIIRAYSDIRDIDRTYSSVAGTYEMLYKRYIKTFLRCDFDKISLARYWHEAQILFTWQGWYFSYYLDYVADIHWFLKYMRSLSMLRRDQIYDLDFVVDQHDSFIWTRDIENFHLRGIIQWGSSVGLDCM
uniref:Uncharacterized protein n=1 Tax=Seculamonas ecuadoriensis TaxID=221724 RepID=M4QEE9_SECEC|nr:hypothetical protein L037_mgp49 [Seculamonas ecuadoriensis]AGH24475.1 hypothetical protein [Seculamonas ecuadoriensis]